MREATLDLSCVGVEHIEMMAGPLETSCLSFVGMEHVSYGGGDG